MGVLSFCDDYDYGIKQVAGNDDDDDDDPMTRADIFSFDSFSFSLVFVLKAQGEDPPNTGGGRVFLPLDADLWSSGHY